MDAQRLSDALDAIFDLATDVLECDLPDDVKNKIQAIESIARYKMNVSSPADRAVAFDHIVEEHEHELGGINYRVMAISDENAYWGKWFCRGCGSSGSSSKRCTSVEEATSAAEVNLQMHHTMSHGNKQS